MRSQDCLINFKFTGDPNGHICEMQLVHQKLWLARAGMVSDCVWRSVCTGSIGHLHCAAGWPFGLCRSTRSARITCGHAVKTSRPIANNTCLNHGGLNVTFHHGGGVPSLTSTNALQQNVSFQLINCSSVCWERCDPGRTQELCVRGGLHWKIVEQIALGALSIKLHCWLRVRHS